MTAVIEALVRAECAVPAQVAETLCNARRMWLVLSAKDVADVTLFELLLRAAMT